MQAVPDFWIDIYFGPPDITVQEIGKNFIVRTFQSNAALLKITKNVIPIKSLNSLSLAERYYEPLRGTTRIVLREASTTAFPYALRFVVESL